MTVEVVGYVDRENGCYLAGEDVLVTVELKNLDLDNDDVLAWICVQLHCDRFFMRGGRMPENQSSNATDSTSVKAPKEAIYSSKPDIILCNWNVAKGGSEVRRSNLKIPLGLPPTFKGYFLRYNWHIQIAVQRIDKPIQTFYLPLKIINSTVNIQFEAPVVDNPFLRNDIEQPTPLMLAMEQIEEKTSGSRKVSVYDVASEGDVFASVNVATGPFKLGDVVQGSIEFPVAEEGKPTCVQMLVRAETVEEALYTEVNNVHYATHSSTQVTTAFMKGCHFRVPLKLSSTPTFTEQAVKLTWRIHFEFMITKNALLTTIGNTDKPASSLGVCTLVLDHTIFVHSCNPLNVGLVTNPTQSKCAINV